MIVLLSVTSSLVKHILNCPTLAQVILNMRYFSCKLTRELSITINTIYQQPKAQPTAMIQAVIAGE